MLKLALVICQLHLRNINSENREKKDVVDANAEAEAANLPILSIRFLHSTVLHSFPLHFSSFPFTSLLFLQSMKLSTLTFSTITNKYIIVILTTSGPFIVF